MAINKLTPFPPTRQTMEGFISGKELQDHTTDDGISFPWEHPNVRKDVNRAFTVQLPEEYILKIKYFSEKTHISQQEVVRHAIKKDIDLLLEHLVVLEEDGTFKGKLGKGINPKISKK